MSIPAHLIDAARRTPIENVIDAHGIKLRGKTDRCGPCPRCGGHDRFSINVEKQVFLCRGCGAKGDVIALVQHVDGCDFREAVERLAGRPIEARQRPSKRAEAADTAETAQQARTRANRYWSESIDPRGTIVETYLATRCLDLPDEIAGAVIRFHRRCPWRDDDGAVIYVPAMICAMRSIATDEITAVHRTRLSPEGLKLDRRMRGVTAGAAIKLDADEDVTNGLHICEGVESGLAARALGFRPIWALGSAGGRTNEGKTYGGIADFPVLGGVECLTILVENDGPSERAAALCTARWHEAGREVLHARSLIGSDANDALRRKVTQ